MAVGVAVRVGRGVAVRVGRGVGVAVAVGVGVDVGVGVTVATGANPSPAVSGSDDRPTLCPDSVLAAVVSPAATTNPSTAASATAAVRRQPFTPSPL
ncbi:hypothetical protein OJ997_34810 [Solirubrobacter phytolaccae]|uniref:Uncharacterized protein n=1 Tax=Solirubrobacter phytolaccae TaxID=1404360 RepID=A0A9X3NHQ7_9ACTN|nr:hypothetical protein [Solirubrobacter phytolaccae]MDA0185529.1 hypothetical protein [Solirubrobacter phytolaccae]